MANRREFFQDDKPPPLFAAAEAPRPRPVGPFEMGAAEREVWRLIEPRGKGRPISRKAIEAATGLSERDVKAAVMSLRRDFRLPIVAERGRDSGYWTARTARELEEGARAYYQQIVSSFAVWTAFRPTKRQVLEAERQLRLALEAAEEDET